MPTRARTSSGRSMTSRPSTEARPSLGSMSAVSSRTVVVLPAPFGPEQPEDLAAEHLEVHAADRPQLAEAPAQTGRAEHDGIGRGHRPQSDGACHNRPVTRPWTLPEVTGIGRLPMHSVEHHDRLPLDGRWRFQLLANARRRDRSGLVRGGRARPLDDGRAPGTRRTTRTSRCRSRAGRRRSRRSTRPASTSASSRSRRPGPGRRIVLHVGAAESVLIVTLNGDEVGVGKDSHLASEFDLTDRLRPGTQHPDACASSSGRTRRSSRTRTSGGTAGSPARCSCTRRATSTWPTCGSTPAWPTT